LTIRNAPANRPLGQMGGGVRALGQGVRGHR